MTTLPTSEPRQITAGDTLQFKKTLDDWPPDAWTLAYRLINGGQIIDIGSVADGDGHLVNVAAAVTAAWTPGDYQYFAYVTGGDERYTLHRGQIEITPDIPAAVDGIDTRGLAEKTLDDLLAAAAAYAASSGHISEYEIAGRKMRFRSAMEIEQHIQLWRRELAREQRAARLAAGLSVHNTIRVRL